MLDFARLDRHARSSAGTPDGPHGNGSVALYESSKTAEDNRHESFRSEAPGQSIGKNAVPIRQRTEWCLACATEGPIPATVELSPTTQTATKRFTSTRSNRRGCSKRLRLPDSESLVRPRHGCPKPKSHLPQRRRCVPRRRTHAHRVLLQKRFPIRGVTKRLSASRPRHGQRANDIRVFQALFHFAAANELVE
jgi:hypothetical protein